jgi:hypothetical protein
VPWRVWHWPKYYRQWREGQDDEIAELHGETTQVLREVTDALLRLRADTDQLEGAILDLMGDMDEQHHRG